VLESCPHVREHSPEVCSVQCNLIHQRKECDFDRKKLHDKKAEFRRRKLLGTRYYVSTVGLDEESVRQYIREQEAEDARLEQLNMLDAETPPSESS
jgi:hypothetical protein